MQRLSHEDVRRKFKAQEESSEGNESEVSKHIRNLAKHQRETDMGKQEIQKRFRSFEGGSALQPEASKITGITSSDDLRLANERDSRVQNLSASGLTPSEIQKKLHSEGFVKDLPQRPLAQRAVLEGEVDAIEQTMKDHENEISSQRRPKGGLKMRKLEAEVERSRLMREGKADELKKLDYLTDTSSSSSGLVRPSNHPIHFIREMYEKIQNRTVSNTSCEEFDSESDSGSEHSQDPNEQSEGAMCVPIKEGQVGFIGPQRRPVEPIPRDVVEQYRLTLDQIRNIPRFTDYDPGIPNNVLYIKNLSSKVNEEDLGALFSSLRAENIEPQIRLLAGRMRGQAFVTFADVGSAEKALRLANGFPLKGKPLIIQFGRKG